MLEFYFQWPWMLLLLLLIPVYWWLARRRAAESWHHALSFSATSTLELLRREGFQQGKRQWRRLLGLLLPSVAMIGLVLALARPVWVTLVHTRATNVMLVMDISISMLAKDVKPTRMEAARKAAVDFVTRLPKNVRVGLVFFAGNTYTASPPTDKHREIIAYLNSLELGDLRPHTEIGTAIQSAMQALQVKQSKSAEQNQDKTSKKAVVHPEKPAAFMVLISDGDSREGYPWQTAATEARKAGIQIDTIGIGQDMPTTIVYQGIELPVLFSENTLREIAKITDGRYFRASSPDDLASIYRQVRRSTLDIEEKTEELTVIPVALALLALVLGYILKPRLL